MRLFVSVALLQTSPSSFMLISRFVSCGQWELVVADAVLIYMIWTNAFAASFNLENELAEQAKTDRTECLQDPTRIGVHVHASTHWLFLFLSFFFSLSLSLSRSPSLNIHAYVAGEPWINYMRIGLNLSSFGSPSLVGCWFNMQRGRGRP